MYFNSHLILLSVACSSLVYLLYRKRNSYPTISSPSSSPAFESSSSLPAYIKHEPSIPTTFIYPQEPDYFPFTEAIKGKVRMGVKRMELNAWIEIGYTFEEQVKLKKTILQENRPLAWVSKESEKTDFAKREVLDMLVDYLPNHFPALYKVQDGFTGDSWRVVGKLDMDPFEIANMLIQEDLVIMEQENDQMIITAGCVCFPSKWNVRDKFMQNLPLVHEPVPPFEKHLSNPVMKVLLDLKPDYPIWRANWSILDELNGANTLFLPYGRPINEKVVTDPEQVGDKVMYRVERQTLRRLPKSNTVLFTIRTYQRPLKEVAKHKEVIPKLISAIQDMEPGMIAYKSRDLWMDEVIEYLTKQMDSALHS